MDSRPYWFYTKTGAHSCTGLDSRPYWFYTKTGAHSCTGLDSRPYCLRWLMFASYSLGSFDSHPTAQAMVTRVTMAMVLFY